MILTSCASHKSVQTQLVETNRHDTLYINKESFDSTYIDNSHLVDRGGDTVYIKDKLIEYRYRFLRDTIRIAKCDSIPYEVRITEAIEVPRKLTWYDHTARATFWLLIGVILLWLYRRIHKR